MSGMYKSAGVIAPIACGEYDKDAIYFQLNIVTLYGDSWLCRKMCKNVEPNLQNTEYWQPCGHSIALVREYVEQAKQYAEEAAAIAGATIMKGATESEDGVRGFVPSPRAGQQNDFLAGDGTFKPVNVDEKANGKGITFSVRDGKVYMTYTYEIDDGDIPPDEIIDIVENIFDNDESNDAPEVTDITDIVENIFDGDISNDESPHQNVDDIINKIFGS